MNGFATTMYLDSNEGRVFGSRLGDGWTVKDAFFYGAAYYQPQLGSEVIARTKGHSTAELDTKATSPNRVSAYSSTTASSYKTWDKVITP